MKSILNDELYIISLKAEKIGKKNKSNFWLSVSRQLRKSRRNRAEINLNQISRLTSPGETVIVCGKLLGGGKINHPVTIASFSASSSAIKKLTDVGGKYVTLEKLLVENPKGKGLRLVR